MPALLITTNAKLDGIDTSALLAEFSATIAKTMGKPTEKFVMVSLNASVPMLFGGTDEPTVFAEMGSIGGLNPESNKLLSAAICSILETKLSVPPKRVFIKFSPNEGPYVGWNGTTF